MKGVVFKFGGRENRKGEIKEETRKEEEEKRRIVF